MIDLFDVIKKQREKEARENLMQLQITNARHMDEKDYKKFVQNLNKQAGLNDKNEKFDRSKMDALHAFTQKMNGG